MPPTTHKLGARGVRLGRIRGLGTRLSVLSMRSASTFLSTPIQGGTTSPNSLSLHLSTSAALLDLEIANAFNAQDLSLRDDSPAEPAPSPVSPGPSLYTPVIVPISKIRLPPSVPAQSATPNSQSRRTFNSVVIASAILFCIFIGLTVVLLRMSVSRWWLCFRRIFRRRLRLIGKSHQEGEGNALVVKVEYDDKTWGTSARTQAGCKIQKHFHDHVLQFTSTPPLLLEKPRSLTSLTTIQEEFDERLRDEEFDIALALDFALRNHCDVPPAAEGGFGFPASCDSPALHNPNGPESLSCGYHIPTSHRVSRSLAPHKENNRPYILPTAHYSPPSMRHFDDVDDVSAMLSLQAGLQSLGRRNGRGTAVLPTLKPTPETPFTHEEHEETEELPVTTADDDDEYEEVVEVRHAQSKSVELRKGILLTLPTFDQSLLLPPAHPPPPNLIISSPTVTLSTPKSTPSTTPPSPIEWQHTGEAYLCPPGIVYPQLKPRGAVGIMSSSSSVSVDLDDFPLPPAMLGASLGFGVDGSFFSDTGKMEKFGDEMSSLADKRTTVERLIMMYGNV